MATPENSSDFNSEGSSLPPFIVRVKKTYKEEISLIPTYNFTTTQGDNSSFKHPDRFPGSAVQENDSWNIMPTGHISKISNVPGETFSNLSFLIPDMFANENPRISGQSAMHFGALSTKNNSASQCCHWSAEAPMAIELPDFFKHCPQMPKHSINFGIDAEISQKVPLLTLPIQNETLGKTPFSPLTANLVAKGKLMPMLTSWSEANKYRSGPAGSQDYEPPSSIGSNAETFQEVPISAFDIDRPVIGSKCGTSMRRRLNSEAKSKSPWPEMPQDDTLEEQAEIFNSGKRVQECDELVSVSVDSKGAVVTTAGKITSGSPVVDTTILLSPPIFTDQPMLNTPYCLNHSDSNPLQIPWSDIMTDVLEGQHSWPKRDIGKEPNEEPTTSYPSPSEINTVSTSQWSLPMDQEVLTDTEHIVPTDFNEDVLSPIVPFSSQSCPEMVQEVVLSSITPEPEINLFGSGNDHNYFRKAALLSPLTSSPWLNASYALSIAELEQGFSPISSTSLIGTCRKSIAEDRCRPENIHFPHNFTVVDLFDSICSEKNGDDDMSQNGNVNGFKSYIEKGIDVLDHNESSAYDCEADSVIIGSNDMQICPQAIQEKVVSKPEKDLIVTKDEQAVPNLDKMEPLSKTSAFQHSDKFEEFYSSGTPEKHHRIHKKQVDGARWRPIRIGLSKNHRVSPLHDLKTIQK